jgi:hypothetical protein
MRVARFPHEGAIRVGAAGGSEIHPFDGAPALDIPAARPPRHRRLRSH